jgi:exodeoxyribonuclease III
MKIATWNVNGIRARQEQVLAWVQQERPDVVCLQEIKAELAQVPAALCEMEDYWCYWHGAKGYSGVGLHIRKSLCPERPVFQHPPFDMENRIVTADLGPTTVASVYVPNGGKDYRAKLRFLAAMDEYAAALRSTGDELVICGDINIARTEMDVHPKERAPVIGQSEEERAWFQQLLDRGFVDVGRAMDPENDGLFTWWAPWRQMRQRNIGWRLDYILATSGLGEKATSCVVQKDVGTSDHAPVVAVFAD